MPQMTARERVYQSILTKLIQQELRPGDWLDRRKIAAEIKCSLIPVAEAVQQLSNEGYLDAVSRKGTQVRLPSRREVLELLLVREALECQAVRIYCGAPMQPHMKRLKEMAAAADDRTVPEACWAADAALHIALVELTGFRAMVEAVRAVKLRTIFHRVALIMQPNPDSHLRLINDLSKMGPRDAEDRIRLHIRCNSDLFDGLP
ncbi:DNA-binding transcriptional regulator, GntR family [Singulisphaera sp. GP187]|uniref:GntR family transcriptional regulator n=1 Tax=Singulisphaera sp. GP187 TaxID=1882752 RepID=UPI00092732A3|nr:GntR family transcriptional regulator [Singulisphaera sp. GP187]SIO39569.1 DNA-binding transcriptional regulator, GntR family [Singulisphaera sp. GP187]